MNNGLDKNLIIKQNKENHVKQNRPLNIGFYNMDIETAKLNFQVTDDTKPLLLGSRNVTCFAFLESTNGSNSGVLNLNYEDPMNGILSLIVPKDFLQESTNTTVTGQIYISVNGRETTMALDEFEFEVRDSLINKITGEEKVKTIRMFYELREAVEKQVSNLQEKIETINQTVNDKMNDFNSLFEENKKKLQDDFAVYNNSLNTDYKALDEDIKKQKEKTEELYQQLQTSIEESKTQFYNDLNSKFNESKQKFDEMTSEMEKNIEESKNITFDDIDTKINESNNNLQWQKYKFSEANGSRIYLGELSKRVELLDAGLYECIIPSDAEAVNAPKDKNDSAYIAEINITTGGNGRKQIVLIQNYTQNIWFKTIHTNSVDMGWISIIQQRYDTNWQKIVLKNGAMELGGDYPTSQYRIIKENGLKKVYIKFYLKNVIDGTVIATVPSEIVNGPHFLNCVTKINKNTPKVTINSSGDIIFYKNEKDSWNENDYIIVEENWLVD